MPKAKSSLHIKNNDTGQFKVFQAGDDVPAEWAKHVDDKMQDKAFEKSKASSK